MSRRMHITWGLFGLLGLAGCRVGPDYERPDAAVPEAFRGNEGEEPDPEATALGDLQWSEAFVDPVLQELIRTAIVQNYDVRVAAERVLEARARVTVVRSERYPDVQVGGAFQSAKGTENGTNALPPGIDPETSEYQLVGDLAWEVDFWGRVARATEAARAELLATEFARHTVIQTLVADLALAYFDLLELDAELEISRRTYESRESSYDLVALRLEQGVANRVELRQAESLVLQTAGIVPELERLIAQQENLIKLLVGENPGAVPRGEPLVSQETEGEVPIGLPSDLLERRPDVRMAEQVLTAANARIGEAKARLFPSIRLTAVGGVASEELGDLFESGSDVWSIEPSITQPIFNAGRLRSNVRVTEAQQRQALFGYLQTLQQAFREVADALVARDKTAEIRSWRAQQELALRDQADLSRERYRGGVTSYLEVLDSERGHFDAELSLVRAIRDELFAYVLLYRALGGGWQGTAEVPDSDSEAGAP